MTKISHISAVMIVKNAQNSIRETLKSLQLFQEVVIYDNGSTDKTKEIVNEFSNVVLIEGEFLGFGPTKNRAASYAKNSWIFSIDSDETLDEKLQQSLKTIKLDNKKLYTIQRTNFYKNQQIKHCWGDDIIIRLYNKEATSFTDKQVHEKIVSDGFQIQMLQGLLNHYPYGSISDFIIKLDRYSTIYAQDNQGTKSSSPTKAFFNGLFSFTKTYFFKQGFRDGYAGLVIAFSHMATNFYKYIKLYELNKELKRK